MPTTFRPFAPLDCLPVAEIWNAACGTSLSITTRFVEYNTRASTGASQTGRIALRDHQPIGFVLASALLNDPHTSPRDLGWIDALAVLPEFQRHGIGGDLLAWAEMWLRNLGCTRVRLGGSLRPFAPGYPSQLHNIEFFKKRGYVERPGSEQVWDVAQDLQSYQVRRTTSAVGAIIRPAQANDESALLNFLRREFPGRWRYEFQEFLQERGRWDDYMILVTARGIDGFAHLTLENSIRPIERFYMQRLPRPWGQLGPIGMSQATRGKGYGGALLDASLRYLREQGVRGCVIDWTDLVDFYNKFGFKRFRKYMILVKQL